MLSVETKKSVYNYSPVKICQQLANLLPTFNYLPLTSHLDFTGSSLTGKGRWQLLATTAMLPTTTKHFDRAIIINIDVIWDSACIFKLKVILFVHSITTPIEEAVDDDASLARHSKRLQDELEKSSPDEEVIKELMDAEFQTRRSFVTKIDVRTRIRDTLAKYHLLGNGSEVF